MDYCKRQVSLCAIEGSCFSSPLGVKGGPYDITGVAVSVGVYEGVVVSGLPACQESHVQQSGMQFQLRVVRTSCWFAKRNDL